MPYDPTQEVHDVTVVHFDELDEINSDNNTEDDDSTDFVDGSGEVKVKGSSTSSAVLDNFQGRVITTVNDVAVASVSDITFLCENSGCGYGLHDVGSDMPENLGGRGRGRGGRRGRSRVV